MVATDPPPTVFLSLIYNLFCKKIFETAARILKNKILVGFILDLFLLILDVLLFLLQNFWNFILMLDCQEIYILKILCQFLYGDK